MVEAQDGPSLYPDSLLLAERGMKQRQKNLILGEAGDRTLALGVQDSFTQGAIMSTSRIWGYKADKALLPQFGELRCGREKQK